VSLVVWASLVVLLVLQAPGQAALAVAVPGSHDGVSAADQSPSPGKPTGPAAQAGSSARGPSSNRPPNGQRPGQGPSLIDDLRFFWWRDPDVKRELGLSEEAVKAINTIFQQREKESFPVAQRWREESRTLEKMTREGTTDINTYSQQVRMVDNYRSILDTSRTVMIYSMFKQLRPDQFEKLKQIAERRDRDRNRPAGAK
jgi:hypothetical protein